MNSSSQLWHNCLGHIPYHKMKMMSITSDHSSIQSCMICSKAKQQRLSFPTSVSVSNAQFELIHIDVWGPYKHATYDGFKYFLTIVDDYNRHTWFTC